MTARAGCIRSIMGRREQLDLWTPAMSDHNHTVRLACDIGDLHLARANTRGWIDSAGFDSDDAVLVASELLTNAIVHAGSAPTLTVRIGHDHIRLEVSDQSSVPPRISGRADGGGGFGLRVVDVASRAWGWIPNASGKTVWSEVAARRRP